MVHQYGKFQTKPIINILKNCTLSSLLSGSVCVSESVTLGKDGYMAVKLDMSKAYDRVEWFFIENVMRRLGFHERWVDWILRCITIVSYFVLINGESHGCITPSRGLR